MALSYPDPFQNRTVHVVAPAEDSSGSLLGHIVLYRDVTHEVEVEKAKTEFVSMVSHELRTPMTSVKTSLTLLVEGAGGRLDPAAHELLEVALRNADRLIRLVNDLLDLSRLEAGRMDLRVEPVAVADAVAASIEMVAAFSEARGVTLRTDPPAEPQIVSAERDRLVQVIVNLLSNAIKFSPKGGCVDVRWWRQDEWVVTEVRDHGAGIPRDQLKVVFDPFRQLDSSTTREHGGAGLGLTIAQRIAQAFGGELNVESEVSKGSRFSIRLPVADRISGDPNELVSTNPLQS